MFKRILVVCVGNICRSPTGERLLRQQLPDLNIDSAGLSALVGHAADDMAQRVAQQHGLDLGGHAARQLTADLCSNYDLILVMEQGHIEMVCRIEPKARSKTMLFGQWLTDSTKNVPDPYRQSNDIFELVYQQLYRAADLWADKLRRSA